MKLDEKLVRLRKEKGLTQLELAEAVKVSRQAVSKWESGGAVPSTENLIFLCGLYEISLDDLLCDSIEQLNILEKGKASEGSEKNRRQRQKWIVVAFLLVICFVLLFVILENKEKESSLQMKEILGEEVELRGEGNFDIEW